jgi:RNA polymerase sigma-70 factor (ECF subfamily)
MATSVLNPVIGHLRKAVLVRDGAGLTDGQLLESFVRQRDEAAFEALVRRHGPMVLGVCRRVLGNHHDAEDAFQATFLVLARKAGSLLPRGTVAPWLYGVAHRTALKARGVIARRRVRERQVAGMPEPEAAGPDTGGPDLRPLLDRELSGLPDKYRVPIVLCDLEGKAGKEAARQLGWPEGTVASRLSRGRVLLARRLARHGLAFSGGSLAAVLSRDATSAPVPASLVTPTVRAAGCLAAGQALTTGLVSTEVAALTGGVLKAMFLTKLKGGMALFLALGVLGAGLGVTLTCVGGTAGPATAAGVAAPESDQDRLQGTWQQVSCEGPDEIPDDIVKENILVIKNDTMTMTAGKRGGYELTFKLDEGKEPRAIDELLVKPEKGGKPYLGIYSLEGDTLKFCFSDPGEKRPTEFTAKPGSGWTLTVFKRKQPSPAQPAQAKAQGPTPNDTNEKKPPDQNQAKQALDMVLKGFQAYQDSKGSAKKTERPDQAAVDPYAEAFLKAFQLVSKIAEAKAQVRAKIRPEDEAAFDACGPAFVEAYERAKTLKKALEEQRASGGKESERALAALDAFLTAGEEVEQAVKLRAKARAVEQAKREIEDALSKVKRTANDRRTELEALEEIEKAVREMKKRVQGRGDGN